jgi:hypothetical protein
MSNTLHKKLADFSSKGYIIAPAGYGKTHLIALAVNEAETGQHQLILTHTYAGVNSIRNKMKTIGVPSSKYHVDTIASWTLRLCLSYPNTSKWEIDNPEGKQWNQLYKNCYGLLKKGFVRHILSSTYSGIYVDEYQDCSKIQHLLVNSLAEFLPCRILGDPMQSIFDFADEPVDWESSIYPYYERLGELETPWRWKNVGTHEFGDWLKEARKALQNGQQINLDKTLPKDVKKISTDLDDFKNPKRFALFYNFLREPNATVIAIQSGDQKSKNKCHKLARNLGGKFSSLEEVEGKKIFTFIKKYESTETASKRFKLILDFADDCFSNMNKILVAGTKRCEIAKKTSVTKYPLILEAANSYLNDPTSKNLSNLFYLFKQNSETNLCRRDLFNRFMNVLKVHISSSDLTLLEAANLYQKDFRYLGRPLRHTKQIATTLLVKGLEYDHAVILDAESLDARQLYVAMTRGAKSLTIISKESELPVL